MIEVQKKNGARNSHFHPTDVPTQTHPRPGAKRKEEPLHVSVTPLGAVLAFGFGLLDPALWSENFNVVAEDSRVSVDDPRVSTHGRAGRDEFAGDCRAGRGRHAREGHADGGMQAEGFVHDGLEVGKAVCLGERDGEGELALFPGGVELGDEFGFAGGVLEEVVDDRAGGDGGCVGAGEDVGGCHGGEGLGVEGCWLGRVGGEEVGEDVFAIGAAVFAGGDLVGGGGA